MNDGISAAHGEYIGIVEPDDYVSLEMFGDLYNIAVSGDTKMDVVKSAWYQFSSGGNGDNKLINPYKSVPQRCSIDVRAHSRILLYHPSIWSGIYRAGFLEGHSIRFLEAPGAGWVDNPFFLETLYYSENTAVTCQPYYHYQVARDGGSSSMKDCLVPFLRLGEMFDFLESKSDSSIFFESLCKRFFFYLRNVLNSPYYGERERETRELISSIVSRIPGHILEGALFTDRDRKNYARFSSANYSTSQMGDPKVSVIVPCFNTVDYLAECLDSLVEQTLEDIEIICVDDGSTDDTRFMLREYAADDSRVRVICQIENGGYGKAVNAGLKQARGEYVGIVEPDDFVDARTYKVLYSEAVGNCLDVCKADFCRFWREDSGNLKTSYVRVCSKDEFYGVVFDPSLNQETLIGVPPSICAGLYKRDFLRRNCVWVNETPGASYQDNGFFFQTMFSAKRVKYLKRCFYWCRRDNPNSSVHNTGKVYAMNEEYEFIERWLKEDPLRWEKCKEAYISIAFANYLWTLNRIGVEHKREYLNYLSQALSEFISENKVNLSKCSDSAKSKIRWIISDPESFYSQNIINSREVARLKKENGALRKRVEKFQASPSWRIGRAITFLPRKLKKALKKTA